MKVLISAVAGWTALATCLVHETNGVSLRAAHQTLQHAAEEVCANKFYLPSFIECLNENVKVPSKNARQEILTLSEIFENNYAFVDIACDPLATPQENSMNWPVYKYGYNLVEELERSLEQFPDDDSDVPLFSLTSTISDRFAKLRDQHVYPLGSYNPDHSLPVAPFHMQVYDLQSGNLTANEFQAAPVWIRVQAPTNQEGEPVFIATLGKKEFVVNKIDGRLPMDWITTELANTTACTDSVFRVRGLGNRINQALKIAASSGLGYCWLQDVGDISHLKPSFSVELEGGEEKTWFWLVGRDGVLLTTKSTPNNIYSALEGTLSGLQDDISPSDRANLLQTKSRTLRSRDVTIEEWAKSHASTFCDESEKYCVIKFTSFSIVGSLKKAAELWVAVFNRLNQIAKENNITKLILDVNGNPGGVIEFGLLVCKSLFPDAQPEDLLPLLAYKVSEAEEWRLKRNLTSATMRETFDREANSDFWDDRAAELKKDNCKQLYKEQTVLRKIWKGVRDLNEASPAYQDIFDPASFDSMLDAIDSIGEVATACNFTGPELESFVLNFQDFYDTLERNNRMLDLDSVEFKTLGRKRALYTKPKNVFLQLFAFSGALDRSVFDDILLLSDGYCGSTCGFLGVAALTNAKLKPGSPTFRTVVYGGNGKAPQDQDLVPTVFQGGNVLSVDQYTYSWTLYALYASVYRVSGLSSLSDIDDYGALIPHYPIYNNNPPGYVYGGAYVPLLGKNSLFSEFYMIPADLYIRHWYFDTGIDGADLSSLYGNATLFFN